MSRLVSFAVLIGVLVLFAILFYQVMAVFLLPVFVAALLGVVFQPLHRWSLEKCRGATYIASGLTTFLVLLSVLAPAGLVISLAAIQGLSLIEHVKAMDVRGKLKDLREQLRLEIPHADDLHRVEAALRRWAEQQRQGDWPAIDKTAVDNLVARVNTLDAYLEKNQAAIRVAEADISVDSLRESLRDLRGCLERLSAAPANSVERDEALHDADQQFKLFRLAFLGGNYKAWLKEAANPSDEQLQQLRSTLTRTTGSPLLAVGGDTAAALGKGILGGLISLTALFFFFAEGSRMLDAAIRLSPLEAHYVRELVDEFERVCRAVVAATLLAAVGQGIVAGIGFYFAGLSASVALLMLLTMVLAMIPFLGAAAVWAPVCLYLYFVEGRLSAAVLLAIYGAGVISTVDNFIKPFVLHGQSNLHPLLALLSVLGGVQALGPVGIIVGPLVVVFLQTLLKILQRELTSLDRQALWTQGRSLFTVSGAAGDEPPPHTTAAPASAVNSDLSKPSENSASIKTTSPPARNGKKKKK